MLIQLGINCLFVYCQRSVVWMQANAFTCDKNGDLFLMSQYEFKQGVIKQRHSLPDTDMVDLFCMGTPCSPWLGMRKKILPLPGVS